MDISPRTTVDAQIERAKKEGWVYRGDMATEGEVLDLLYSLVRITKPEIVVETGTYHGHGAQTLATALNANEKGTLYTVEQDEALVNAFIQVPRVNYICADSIKWSAEEAPSPIDLAFVDCGAPGDRIQVFKNLLPKMAPDGVILVHDTAFYESGFLEALSMAYGCPPNFNFPALNGVVGWQT